MSKNAHSSLEIQLETPKGEDQDPGVTIFYPNQYVTIAA